MSMCNQSARVECQLKHQYSCGLQAFVKARGDGLGFDLGRVEFELAPCSISLLTTQQSATARVDGTTLHK